MNRPSGFTQSYKGHMVWPFDPTPESLDIEDIAQALSNICRYNGHCRKFYSVAEHSVLMARFAAHPVKLLVLLHDAAEAYLTDLPTPIKQDFPEYILAEKKLLTVIFRRFGIRDEMAWIWNDFVRRLDKAILATECFQVMGGEIAGKWYLPEKPLEIKIKCWKPRKAKKEFLKLFYKSGGICYG